MELLIPLGLILGGVLGLVIYTLAAAVRQLSNQLTKVNERLLVLLGAVQGGDHVARALVASARPPQNMKSGIAKTETKDTLPSAGGFTMGVR